MWEGTLEKLKILDYEIGYCLTRGKKPFSRIHFVFPAANLSHQFEDFIGICEWLFGEITKDSAFFKRDQYDDPNTVANKLMLALRQVDFRLSFPAQKLRQANGEQVCSVLEFLADKALATKNFKFGVPLYADNDKVEMAPPVDDNEDVEDEIHDEADEEVFIDESIAGQTGAADLNDSQLDGSSRQILYGQIDPLEWKTELERVSQKLKTQQVVSTNEWRAHVDQTGTSKEAIEGILKDSSSDLNALSRYNPLLRSRYAVMGVQGCDRRVGSFEDQREIHQRAVLAAQQRIQRGRWRGIDLSRAIMTVCADKIAFGRIRIEKWENQ